MSGWIKNQPDKFKVDFKRGRTIVRFRDPVPSCSTRVRNEELGKKLDGQLVQIFIRPILAQAHITCGEKIAWIVPDDEVKRLLGFVPDRPVTVCTHQVDID